LPDSTRKHRRIAQGHELVWAIKARGVSGRGKLIDVSLSGACLEMNHEQAFDKGQTVSVVCSRLAALPATGTIVWVRKTNGHILCGIQFAQVSAGWVSWFNQQVAAA
jgi:hypothetical protein